MAKHDELIGAGSFDSKFKNVIRDYYTYGFKSYMELQSENDKGELKPTTKTINNDWNRLNNLLKDYFEWSVDKKQVFFISADSWSMPVNPFHRIYRFCRYNERDPKCFFNTIFALSKKVRLLRGVESLEINDTLSDGYLRFEDDLERGNPLTSSELLCFYPDGAPLFEGENNTINKKLKELKEMGFISDISEHRKKATHRWLLKEKTLDQLLKNGERVDPNFQAHFIDALDFFSKYASLGTVGSILLGRFSSTSKSAFRFKHAYYMQSLNDYSLLDLLEAIEKQDWCKIDYRHAVTGESGSLICFPLEIRMSATSGREYVSFYEPFSRSYSHLRLEFIDHIEIVSKLEGIDQAIVQADLQNVREALKYCWGASTTYEPIGNAKQKVPLYAIDMKIACDFEKEGFIRERLAREKRMGEIQLYPDAIGFKVKVTDDRELRPWLRSFYKRLIDLKGLNFDIAEDLAQIVDVNENGLRQHDTSFSPSMPWSIPPTCHYQSRPSKAHMQLFNEYFSIYYAVIGAVLMTIYSDDREAFLEEEIQMIMDEVIKAYEAQLGLQSKALLHDTIWELMQSGAFMKKGVMEIKGFWTGKNQYGMWQAKPDPSPNGRWAVAYLKKYQTEERSFNTAILPLSKLECRWLLTILSDPKMTLFLNEEEIQSIRQTLADDKPLLLASIIQTDRFAVSDQVKQQERNVMNLLLGAIEHHQKVFIQYNPRHQPEFSGVFYPIMIEYDQRDNVFRSYFYSEKRQTITLMNLARIEACQVLKEETFAYDSAYAALEAYRGEHQASLTIELSEEKNTPDRILYELSPWKKRCRYDRNQKVYTLTIYYQDNDWMELVMRLLGYGPVIRILDRDSNIYQEYQQRLKEQLEIEKTKASFAGV